MPEHNSLPIPYVGEIGFSRFEVEILTSEERKCLEQMRTSASWTTPNVVGTDQLTEP